MTALHLLAEMTEVKEGYSGLISSGIIVVAIICVIAWWLRR